MNDVVVMVERNRRNKLTANFSVTKDFKISAQICSGNLYPTENAFFVEVRGLKKNFDRDRDWAKTALEITGLRDNFGRD